MSKTSCHICNELRLVKLIVPGIFKQKRPRSTISFKFSVISKVKCGYSDILLVSAFTFSFYLFMLILYVPVNNFSHVAMGRLRLNQY